MQITGPPSRRANQKLRQGWGPGICGFTSPLGDECSGLRTAGMNEVSLPAISEREQEGKEQAPAVYFHEGEGERAPIPPSRHTGLCPCGEGGRAAGVMQHGKEMFKPGWKDGDKARCRRGPKGSREVGDVPSQCLSSPSSTCSVQSACPRRPVTRAMHCYLQIWQCHIYECFLITLEVSRTPTQLSQNSVFQTIGHFNRIEKKSAGT